MKELNTNGVYSVDAKTLKKLQMLFVGGFADETGVSKTILDVYDRTDNVIDTHTAVGFNIYNRYHQRSGDEAKTVFASTASPFKFSPAVMDALRWNLLLGASPEQKQEGYKAVVELMLVYIRNRTIALTEGFQNPDLFVSLGAEVDNTGTADETTEHSSFTTLSPEASEATSAQSSAHEITSESKKNYVYLFFMIAIIINRNLY